MWLVFCLIWITAEIRLARSKARIDKIQISEQRSQGLLWVGIGTGLGLALLFKTLGWTPIPIDYLPRQLLALLIFGAGLWLRYRAVVRLAEFFTTHVAIQHQHLLIVDGPYRYVRHPAYTGLLLALFAAGLAMGDIFALLLLLLTSFWALAARIAIEEKMLLDKFGNRYVDYCNSTWKLLPGLY
jgi:protein-S-isoprenylcysteine O-methyltransferase Ste14